MTINKIRSGEKLINRLHYVLFQVGKWSCFKFVFKWDYSFVTHQCCTYKNSRGCPYQTDQLSLYRWKKQWFKKWCFTQRHRSKQRESKSWTRLLFPSLVAMLLSPIESHGTLNTHLMGSLYTWQSRDNNVIKCWSKRNVG